LRQLSTRRKHKLYRNVIRLRTGLAAFARINQPAVKSMSQDVVRSFLKTQVTQMGGPPSLLGSIKNLRVMAMRVQFWWLRLRMKRMAYATVLLPHWNKILAQVYHRIFSEMAAEEVKAESAKRQIMNEMQAAPPKLEKNLSQEALGCGSIEKHPEKEGASGAAEGEDQHHQNNKHEDENRALLAAARKRFEEAEERLPAYFVHEVLYGYVKRMQQGHKKRIQEWEKLKQNAEFATDLEGFGVTDATAEHAKAAVANRCRPLPIYIDNKELETLAKESIFRWRSPELAWMKANCRILQKRCFRGWRKAVKKAQQQQHQESSSGGAQGDLT